MNIHIHNAVLNNLLIELSHCPENKQIQLFQEYANKLPKFVIKQLREFLLEYHPFLSDELIDSFLKSNSFSKTKLKDNLVDKLEYSLNLSLLRSKAKKDESKKIIVFCQPKSGSTFLTNLIAKTLNLSVQNLNTFAYFPTNFGINGREQELCELSLIKSIFRASKTGGFIAQHHTRANLYLIKEINYYNLKTIILTRNVFDSLVSKDDFIVEKHQHAKEKNYSNLKINGAEIIPQNYIELSSEDRLDFLTKSYGIWYVQFYLSWKRLSEKIKNSVCWINYENSILNKKNFEKNISKYLNLNDVELFELSKTFDNPESIFTRFNKGKSGRGNRINTESKKFLKDYASSFKELDEIDFVNLFGVE